MRTNQELLLDLHVTIVGFIWALDRLHIKNKKIYKQCVFVKLNAHGLLKIMYLKIVLWKACLITMNGSNTRLMNMG